MPLTRSFKETVQARILNDPGFGVELFAGAMECFLEGDMETGKSVLRDYINATIGFAELSRLTDIPEKSLMRMFSRDGNPLAENLFKVTKSLQEHGGFGVQATAEYPKVEEPRIQNGMAWFISGRCPSFFFPMDYDCIADVPEPHILEGWLGDNPLGQAKLIFLGRGSLAEIRSSLKEGIDDAEVLQSLERVSIGDNA